MHSDLHWPVVAAHLLLSMALLAGAVVLALEALALRSGRAEPVAPLELRRGALVVTAAAGVLLVTGCARDGGRAALGRRRRARRPALAARSR